LQSAVQKAAVNENIVGQKLLKDSAQIG